jgi:hypothetical protein
MNGSSLFFSVDIGSGCTGSPLANCANTGDVDASVGIAVPEASTWAMMLAGLAGLSFAAFRRPTKYRLEGGIA